MSDLNFDIDGKDISSEKIKAGRKDFDSFHKGFVAKTKPFYQKGWFWGGTGLASIIAIVSIFTLTNPNQPDHNDFKNTSSASKPSADSAVVEVKPFVNPPIDGVNVPWEKMLVDASKGGVVTNKAGSKLIFEANSFVDSTGAKITEGQVEIRYREFKDQIDQIVSGIPMTYDSAGTTYQFLSAGMMEVKGFIGEQEVKMAPEKSIKVEMVSNQTGTQYNLYKLNEEERNWDCLGKDKVVTAEKPNPNAPTIEEQAEETKVAVAELQKVPEFKKLKKKRVQIQAEITEIEKSEPKAPRKADPKKQNIGFDFKKEEFPELVANKGVKFELLAGQKVNNDDQKRVWNDINIEKLNGDYQLTLKEQESGYTMKYKVVPVYEGKSYDEAQELYLADFEDYQSKLGERKEEEGAVVAKIRAAKKRFLERTLKKTNLAVYYTKRVFNANSFGVYNCDNAAKRAVFQTGKQKVNSITFDDRNSKGEQVYYVDASMNTYLNRTLMKGGDFEYRKKGRNHLISVKGNEAGIVTAEEFDAVVKGGGNFVFTVKSFVTYQEFKELVKF